MVKENETMREMRQTPALSYYDQFRIMHEQ